jgi:secondary thiamine-phosphate synthase enzyme
MIHQEQLIFSMKGRGFVDITRDVEKVVSNKKIQTGLCHCLLKHTSASLILCENADPQVRRDLETFMQRIAPDGDADFLHTAEGPDDMPAHVRSILTQNSLSIPITNNKLNLGTWQGLYLWEHRLQHFNRKLIVTVMGE